MVPLFLAFLVASVTSCEVPHSDIGDFDLEKYANAWHELYKMGNTIDIENNYTCEIDNIQKSTSGEGYTLETSAYTLTQKKRTFIVGTVRQVENNVLYFDYVTNSLWSGNYTVICTDYENYQIMAACLANLNEPLIWIGFKTWDPSEEAVNLAKASLEKNNLSFDKFHQNCEKDHQKK